MHYQIARNGQNYGPYTLEDLQRYLASGNVLPTDLCKSEEMPEWLPVSQVVAGINTPVNPAAFSGSSYAEPGPAAAPAPSTAFSSPGYANPGYAAPVYPVGDPAYNPLANPAGLAASPYPDAPNLHWGLVLLFNVLTCGLFMAVWNIIIAAWLKRVQPNATSLYYYIGAIVISVIQLGVFVPLAMHHVPGANGGSNPVGGLLWLVGWVVRLVARFMQRASLQEHFNGPEPVGLQLNPVMTFFFGGLYFQSQINRINQIKQAARYGQARAY